MSTLRGRALIVAMVISVAMLTGCAHVRPSQAPEAPDLSGMIEVVGRFTIAHACPVGPWLMYTSAHVVDERPFDKETPLSAVRLGLVSGWESIGGPLFVDKTSDLAAVRPYHELRHWFPRAPKAPEVGERLYAIGYRWDSRSQFAQPKPVTALVLRVLAGHVALSHGGGPGSSGSCWINAKGEAVAVHAWGPSCGLGEPCGMAPGIWGDWRFEGEEAH